MTPTTPLNAVGTAEADAAAAAGVAIDNAGLAVLQTLRGYGIDTVFGIPGTHNLEFYRHLPRLGIRGRASNAKARALGWTPRSNEEALLADMNERFRDVRVFPDGAVYVLTDGRAGKLLKLTPK